MKSQLTWNFPYGFLITRSTPLYNIETNLHSHSSIIQHVIISMILFAGKRLYCVLLNRIQSEPRFIRQTNYHSSLL